MENHPCIFLVKPHTHFVTDKQLICQVRRRVEEQKIIVAQGELPDRPVQFFSQIILQFGFLSCFFALTLLLYSTTLLKEAISMGMKAYPVIDLVAMGDNIRRLRLERGLTVRDPQSYFGFRGTSSTHKWQKGESLPTVDNLYAWGNLFEVPMDQILVPVAVKLHISVSSRLSPAAQVILRPAILDTARVRCNFNHLIRLLCRRHDKSCAGRSRRR